MAEHVGREIGPRRSAPPPARPADTAAAFRCRRGRGNRPFRGPVVARPSSAAGAAGCTGSCWPDSNEADMSRLAAATRKSRANIASRALSSAAAHSASPPEMKSGYHAPRPTHPPRKIAGPHP